MTLLDGGTGSELRRRGISLTDTAWSAAVTLEQRNLLTAIHRDYVRAGADVITANTFAASRFVLEGAGLGDRFVEINRAALDAARGALAEADPATSDRKSGSRSAETGANVGQLPPTRHRPRPLLAASLSCYPPARNPAGFPPPADELAAYRASTELFADAEADLILVEMMQETEHAPLACRAAAESGLPFWLGICCRLDGRTGRLVGYDRTDVPTADTLARLIEHHPAAIAVMHSPPDAIGPAIELIRSQWAGPIGAYPELAYPRDPDFAATLTDGEPFAPVTPKALAIQARDWIAAGATIVGGCCGTTPAHIAALRVAIDADIA